jgi:hypothetical protein
METVLELLSFADPYESMKLRSNCIDFACKHFSKLVVASEFLEFTINNPELNIEIVKKLKVDAE